MSSKNHSNFIPGKTSWNWLVFFAYLLTLAMSVSRHELWGDEVHSWNIAKNSAGLFDLISNTRFEGHPPVWYILLFALSKFTHDPTCMQYLQFGICAFIAFIFLFKTRLELSYKILILFGYYFIYEYGVFSRNYAVAILFSLLLCLLLNKKDKPGSFVYYAFLLILSNTHFLALILAVSLHVYFLIGLHEAKAKKNQLMVHALTGCILLVPALYFIFPPSNSSLNTSFWITIWNKDHIFLAIQAPLKSLSPVPAWWEYNFWNTHFLLQAQKTYNFLKFFNPLFSVALTAVSVYILYPSKKVLLFFLVNLILTMGFGFIFPLASARYAGFIFISFVLALLLKEQSTEIEKKRKVLLYALLVLQVCGSFIALKKDWEFPFSNVNKIKTLYSGLPANEGLVTDYWCLNYLSAYLDKPVFCLGFNREKSFLLWDTEMKEVIKKKNIYTEGFNAYFDLHNKKEVYFITNTPREDLIARDSLIFESFNVQFLAGQDNAIEKYSNINLYKVSQKAPANN